MEIEGDHELSGGRKAKAARTEKLPPAVEGEAACRLPRAPARHQGHRRVQPRLVRQLPQVLRARRAGVPRRRQLRGGPAPQVPPLGPVGRSPLADRDVPRLSAGAGPRACLPEVVRGRGGGQHERALPCAGIAAAGLRRRRARDERRRAAGPQGPKAGDGGQEPADGRRQAGRRDADRADARAAARLCGHGRRCGRRRRGAGPAAAGGHDGPV
mmetsp:Transcript_28891/g.94912  ORF Transcript_28891/g.94912 Transcript_28891/m.94912 type:complete len:213 (-) Transcript_28891:428-1066(-)